MQGHFGNFNMNNANQQQNQFNLPNQNQVHPQLNQLNQNNFYAQNNNQNIMNQRQNNFFANAMLQQQQNQQPNRVITFPYPNCQKQNQQYPIMNQWQQNQIPVKQNFNNCQNIQINQQQQQKVQRYKPNLINTNEQIKVQQGLIVNKSISDQNVQDVLKTEKFPQYQPNNDQKNIHHYHIYQQQNPILEYCEICQNNINKNEQIITSCCQSKVHTSCYKQGILTKFNQDPNNVKCYKCQNQISNQLIFQFFPEKLKDMNSRIISTQNHCFKCFNCQTRIVYSNQNIIQCSQCNSQICGNCKLQQHGNIKCKQEPIKIPLQQGDQGVICPQCNSFSIKNEGCDHVKCYKCQLDFCSICFVDRYCIMTHGCHYHREGCKYYEGAPEFKNSKYEFSKRCEKCLEQSENYQGCKKPISLAEYQNQNKSLIDMFQTN